MGTDPQGTGGEGEGKSQCGGRYFDSNLTRGSGSVSQNVLSSMGGCVDFTLYHGSLCAQGVLNMLCPYLMDT